MHQSLDNAQMIAFHRSRQNYVAPPDTTLQFAYEDRHYLKFTYQLLHLSDILKFKILKELNLEFHNADRITMALLSSDLLTVLIQHFHHKDNDIRLSSMIAVRQVCSVKMGRQHIMERKSLPQILKMIDDPVEQIRYNAYQAMLQLTQYLQGKDHALGKQLIEKIIDKLSSESLPRILLKCLRLVKNLLQSGEGTQKVLRLRSIEKLSNLLSHEQQDIREIASINMASISYNQLGKAEIISKGCVPKIFVGLKDKFSSVRQATSICLSSLCQRNDGKDAILKQDFKMIAGLLQDENVSTRLNIVQLIASLAQHPKGRKLCQSCLGRLQQMKKLKDMASMQHYIDQTMGVIRWKP